MMDWRHGSVGAKGVVGLALLVQQHAHWCFVRHGCARGCTQGVNDACSVNEHALLCASGPALHSPARTRHWRQRSRGASLFSLLPCPFWQGPGRGAGLPPLNAARRSADGAGAICSVHWYDDVTVVRVWVGGVVRQPGKGSAARRCLCHIRTPNATGEALQGWSGGGLSPFAALVVAVSASPAAPCARTETCFLWSAKRCRDSARAVCLRVGGGGELTWGN